MALISACLRTVHQNYRPLTAARSWSPCHNSLTVSWAVIRAELSCCKWLCALLSHCHWTPLTFWISATLRVITETKRRWDLRLVSRGLEKCAHDDGWPPAAQSPSVLITSSCGRRGANRGLAMINMLGDFHWIRETRGHMNSQSSASATQSPVDFCATKQISGLSHGTRG